MADRFIKTNRCSVNLAHVQRIWAQGGHKNSDGTRTERTWTLEGDAGKDLGTCWHDPVNWHLLDCVVVPAAAGQHATTICVLDGRAYVDRIPIVAWLIDCLNGEGWSQPVLAGTHQPENVDVYIEMPGGRYLLPEVGEFDTLADAIDDTARRHPDPGPRDG